jgi:hypothetical protein
MTVVEQITKEEAIRRRDAAIVNYPDIPSIAAESDCHCCEIDAVADVYGWGAATRAYTEWDGYQFLITAGDTA